MLETKYLFTVVLIVNAFFLVHSATTKRPDTSGSNTHEVTSNEAAGNGKVENATRAPVNTGFPTGIPIENPFARNNIPSDVPAVNVVPSVAPVSNVGPPENVLPTEIPGDNALPTEATESPVNNPILTEKPNVLPTEAPVDIVVPTEIPTENVGPNEPLVLDNVVPTDAPVDNVVPTEAPVDNVVPTEAPVDNFVPTEAPVDNVVPTEAPVDNVVPTEAPVDSVVPTVAVVPTEAPVDTVVPTEAPVDTVVPTEAPVDTVVPTEAPVDNVVPTEAPVDNVVPTEAPVDNVVPTEAVVPTETPVDNVVPTEAPVDNVVPTEAPVENVVPTEAPVENVVTTEAVVPTEAPVDNIVPTEAPVDNVVPTEAPVDNVVPTETVVPTEAPVDNVVPTEAVVSTEAPVDNVVPTEAPVDNVVPTEAPVDNVVPTDAVVPTEVPVDNVAPTEAPVDNVVPTEAPVDNVAPTDAPVTKATSADALSINEPVEVTENENAPTDAPIPTDTTNSDNGPDSESMFPSDIDPFAVGLDPFHSLFGDSHGINIGSPTGPISNIGDNTNQPIIESTTAAATPTPFPIISSTQESNPTIPDVITTGEPGDATEAPSDDTSSTVQPVAMATSASPVIEQSWTHLCTQCNTADQFCNYPHPDDCQIFIECFRSGSGWRATPMLCGHGTFFSEKTKRCDHTYLADCKKDRCTTSAITEYKHNLDTNCATYWECDNQQSKATCCPEGEAYVNGFGCVQDENCTAQCPNPKNTTYTGMPEDFFDFKEDGVCKTNVHLDFEQTTVTNQSPKHNVVAVRNGMDRIVIKDGHGVFKGRSYIFVPYYNHNDYQVKQAFIQFRFLPFTGEGAAKQILVSTCSTNYESTGYSPSIEISLEKASNLLVFTGVTHKRTVQFDLPYRTDQWNKVQFIYDGINTFNATVLPENDKDEIQRKHIVLEGVSEKNPFIKPTMPLRIGSCYRGAWRNDVNDFFQGEMDDIYIASCVPELD